MITWRLVEYDNDGELVGFVGIFSLENKRDAIEAALECTNPNIMLELWRDEKESVTFDPWTQLPLEPDMYEWSLIGEMLPEEALEVV